MSTMKNHLRFVLRIKKGESLAMGKSHRFFKPFAVGLALACAVLASQPVYAQTLLALTCNNVTITEGNSGDFTCTLTNNSGGDLTGVGFTASPSDVVSGDMSDAATLKSLSGSGSMPCTSGGTLSAGQSCEFTVSLNTDNPAGERDNDSGMEMWNVGAGGTTLGIGATPVVTVNDPPPSPVPEPASVVLLGSGLLGTFGLLRRKLL